MTGKGSCASCSKTTMIPPTENRQLPTTRNYPGHCVLTSIKAQRKNSLGSRKDCSIVRTRSVRTRSITQASLRDTQPRSCVRLAQSDNATFMRSGALLFIACIRKRIQASNTGATSSGAQDMRLNMHGSENDCGNKRR